MEMIVQDGDAASDVQICGELVDFLEVRLPDHRTVVSRDLELKGSIDTQIGMLQLYGRIPSMRFSRQQ